MQPSKRDYVTDSDVSDKEPIVFWKTINESVMPGVVPGDPFGFENKNSFHTNKEPKLRINCKDSSRKERVICHTETSGGEISTEECGLMKDLEPMSECARGVVEPVSLVRASTSFV